VNSGTPTRDALVNLTFKGTGGMASTRDALVNLPFKGTGGMAAGRRLGAAEPDTTSESWKNRSIVGSSNNAYDKPARPAREPFQVTIDATFRQSNHPQTKENMKAFSPCL